MTIDVLREFLGWCSVMNIGVLLIWFGFMVFASDFVQKIHGQWFNLDTHQFHQAWYQSMANFKLAVTLFNIVPYFALCLLSS